VAYLQPFSGKHDFFLFFLTLTRPFVASALCETTRCLWRRMKCPRGWHLLACAAVGVARKLVPPEPSPDELRRIQQAAAQAPRQPHIVVTSSMPLQLLLHAETHVIRSAHALRLPLLVFYDADPALNTSDIPTWIHAVNLFEAVPELEAMLAKDSPIERWHGHHGFNERFDHDAVNTHGLQVAKLLVRKVVAIYVALRRLQGLCDLLVWADSDVAFLRPFDRAFTEFALRFDVAYVPFKGVGRYAPYNYSRGFHEPMWYIESGLMSFQPNAASVAFAASAVELYEGGMLRLWDRCKRSRGGHKPPCPPFVHENFYFNDINIWSMIAHLTGTGTRLPETVCCLDSVSDVRQGWFSFHTNTLMQNETQFTSPWPWRLDYYAHHHLAKDGALTQRAQARTNTTPTGVRTKDPRLLITSVNVSAWRNWPWDTERFGIPLRARIAKCGCRSGRDGSGRRLSSSSRSRPRLGFTVP
jgi:hypothetical protein